MGKIIIAKTPAQKKIEAMAEAKNAQFQKKEVLDVQKETKQPDMSKIADIIAASSEEVAAKVASTEGQPKVLPELEDLLDKYEQKESYEELKRSIQADGVRDPAIVWQEENVMVDGHNRLKIANELGIPCPTVLKSFPNIEAVKDFIIRNQLGRRNLSPARFTYFLGKLYNAQKIVEVPDRVASEGGVNTAEKIAKEYDVSAKTVRRAGAQAKGVDMLARVKGQLAKAEQLSNKPTYTAEETQVMGQASNVAVAAKVIEKIDTIHEAKKETKTEAKKAAETVKAKAVLYDVALVKPSFGAPGFSITTEPMPTLNKEAMVYMIVPDESLATGIDLLRRWKLTYEAALVYYSSQTHGGIYTKIAHTFVLLGSKGQVIGPEKGKEQASVINMSGDIEPAIMKTVDIYHPNRKKIDMRRGAKAVTGWDNLTTKK